MAEITIPPPVPPRNRAAVADAAREADDIADGDGGPATVHGTTVTYAACESLSTIDCQAKIERIAQNLAAIGNSAQESPDTRDVETVRAADRALVGDTARERRKVDDIEAHDTEDRICRRNHTSIGDAVGEQRAGLSETRANNDPGA
jgi:hypothetical protein